MEVIYKKRKKKVEEKAKPVNLFVVKGKTLDEQVKMEVVKYRDELIRRWGRG